MIIVRIGLGITTLNGTSTQNLSGTTSRTRSSGRSSAFQRIQLQFAPPSQLDEAETSLQDLNPRIESTRAEEHIPAKQRAVGT